MDIEVKVPASVANLGPGFDCLGAAIGIYLRLRISPSDKPTVTGVGRLRPPEKNLTYQAFLRAFEFFGEGEAPPIEIEQIEVYPSARGMGASASAIVAGLVAAREIGEFSASDVDLAKIAIEMEGHSDNVLPAYFGGLVLSSPHGWLRFEISQEVSLVMLLASDKFQTEKARALLPAEIPREDSVANASATAALVAVLTGSESPQALFWATEDRVHEPYRLPLMGATMDVHQRMRELRYATALAGAGPSLICLVESEREDEAAAAARKVVPDGWEVVAPGWDVEGAQVR
jgi:homoserine kinase